MLHAPPNAHKTLDVAMQASVSSRGPAWGAVFIQGIVCRSAYAWRKKPVNVNHDRILQNGIDSIMIASGREMTCSISS